MIHFALIAVLLSLLLGCAHADRAQIADGATTWVALDHRFRGDGVG